MRIPNIYSEIPRVSPAVIDQIGRHFGFENASDFDPAGDNGYKSARNSSGNRR